MAKPVQQYDSAGCFLKAAMKWLVAQRGPDLVRFLVPSVRLVGMSQCNDGAVGNSPSARILDTHRIK